MAEQGIAYIFGDDIDTDAIIPARYLNTSDPKELASHCMEDADAEFPNKVKPGDVIVGGKNFGCGSSREHAPLAIKTSGVQAVIAKSFARIFFRNSFNIGFPILECPDAVDSISEGDKIEIDFANGKIKNLTKDEVYNSEPFPPFIENLIQAGGLMNLAKKYI